MRINNSIKNTMANTISMISIMLISFITQRFFLENLGTEYLGINGLFTNLITMLSIVELGIGPAIVYSLYKPLADNNINKIKSLLLFYKKAYRLIAVIVLVIGLIILPFVGYIVGENNIEISVYLIFGLFLIDSICSYISTYKRSILYADQKNYLVSMVHLVATVLLNIIQIVILIATGNYIAYLLIKIFMRLIENITITKIANDRYKYLKDNDAEELDKESINDIFKKIKGLIFHKIGSFIVLGTDNILISYFIGIATVGLYSNYLLIVSGVASLTRQVFSSNTSSVGNLLVENNKEKTFDIYNKITFINFYISTLATTFLFVLINPFIEIWLGSQYTFGITIVAIMVANFFVGVMRASITLFKEAAGIYHEDRLIPLFESVVNIVASIIFISLFGLSGVFIGTFISTMVLFLYSYPKFVYKKIFGRSQIEYILNFIKQFAFAFVVVLITYLSANLFSLDNIYIMFGLKILIAFIIPNIIIFLCYFKKEEYKYCIQLGKNIFEKIKFKNKTV